MRERQAAQCARPAAAPLEPAGLVEEGEVVALLATDVVGRGDWRRDSDRRAARATQQHHHDRRADAPRLHKNEAPSGVITDSGYTGAPRSTAVNSSLTSSPRSGSWRSS